MHAEIRISRRAADRIRAGHLWVYRAELIASPASEVEREPGALLTVVDPAGHSLGTALYSTASQIALRFVSRQPISREQYLDELAERIRAALGRRRVVAPLSANSEDRTTAQRIIFAEADGLPGIVADRYADLVILQLLAQGTAQDDVRARLAAVFSAEFTSAGEPLTIWERPDARVRELEQLAPPPQDALFSTTPSSEAKPPSQTTFFLNGLHFGFDASSGQKTGAFLDQRLNYAAAAEWVRASGKTAHTLDVCTYHGGFALHLAPVCQRVTGVDQSRAALEAADRNLALNTYLPAKVDWIEADAFAFLRALDEASREKSTGNSPFGMPGRFGAIVLDPPAFAKSKRAVEGAVRGYKELNLRAMRLLAPGGTLITCSCSHHVSLELFIGVISEAASDAGRRVQLLEVRSAAPDHPEVLTLPETRYLKCLICRVE